MEVNSKKVIQALSLDAKLVYERLKLVPVGAEVEYQELSTLVGRDVTAAGRGLITTARRKALKEDYMVFGVIRKQGLKRLSDVEIVNTGEDTIGRIRRTARKGFRTITAVKDFSALPNDAKIRHNVYVSMLGMVAQASSSPQMKRLEKKVTEASAVLPLMKTLEAFRD